MSRTRLQWAEWMASKGITAFIVDAMSKRPLGGNSWYVRNTSRYTDPDQLEKWFEETPACNYGLWLGQDHVVIDLDVKHAPDGLSGITAFDTICKANGVEDWLIELDTLMVNTPSGGYHLYFKTPHPCANKNTFPDQIDVRGAVGYVVGPGCKVKAGEWTVEDSNAPIMDIPDFLLNYLVTPAAKDPNHHVPLVELDRTENIEKAMDWLKTAKPAIGGENGDDHTYTACCMLRAHVEQSTGGVVTTAEAASAKALAKAKELSEKNGRLSELKWGSPEWVELAKELGHGADEPADDEGNGNE